jgi:hypothetical protein
MINKSITNSAGSEALYIPIFEAVSSNSYLIRIDAPRFTIIAVTYQHLTLNRLKKENVKRAPSPGSLSTQI